MDEKPYTCEVNVTFTQLLSAPDNKSAVRQLKETFLEEYNLRLADDEIKVWDDKGKQVIL